MTSFRGVDINLIARDKNGREERKPLNVIPMCVPNEDRVLSFCGGVGRELEAERARPRAAVKDQGLACSGLQFDARSITAEVISRPPRRGNGASRPPEMYPQL